MPLLDLELARRICEQIALILSAGMPDAPPSPPERSVAEEFAEKLRRRDLREILYLPDLAVPPRWPDGLWREADANKERVFIRVAGSREKIEFACAIFHGSLVHWEHAVASVDGQIEFSPIDPDVHWRMELAAPQGLIRELGLTLIPPAALQLPFGPRTLGELLDPRHDRFAEATREAARMADALSETKGVRSRAQAYQRILAFIRLGYDPATLAAVLEGRKPISLVELVSWVEERNPPFSWTRGGDQQ